MTEYEVMVKIGGNFNRRTIEAQNALAACKKAARNGGFTARDVSNAYTEVDSRMTFFSIKECVSYTVFAD